MRRQWSIALLVDGMKYGIRGDDFDSHSADEFGRTVTEAVKRIRGQEHQVPMLKTNGLPVVDGDSTE